MAVRRELSIGRLVRRNVRWSVPFALALGALFASSLALATAISGARSILAAQVPATSANLGLGAAALAERPVISAASAERLPTAPASLRRAASPTVASFTDDALTRAIQDAIGLHSGVAVVVRRLSDGRSAALQPEKEFYAASLFKLAVLYEAAKRESAGELDPSDLLVLNAGDAAEDLGTFGLLALDENGALPLSEALEAMVTLSDNATGVALLQLLGGDRIDATLRGLGLAATSVNTTDLPTTAADMALLMDAIVRGEGLSPAAHERMLTLLAAQRTRSGLPTGVPANVRVGNKTGTWEGATHDVAFVEAEGGTYVIAVLSDGSWAWDVIARVSAIVYERMRES